jgi:hypothetical protein
MKLVSSIPNIIKGDWNSVANFATTVQKNINKLSSFKLGPESEPAYGTITLTDLTATRLISTDSSKALQSTNLNSWISGTSNQIAIADDGDGTITLSLTGNMDEISALTPTDGNFIVGNDTTWVSESGDTARTSLGLGTGDSPTFAGMTSTGDISLKMGQKMFFDGE